MTPSVCTRRSSQVMCGVLHERATTYGHSRTHRVHTHAYLFFISFSQRTNAIMASLDEFTIASLSEQCALLFTQYLKHPFPGTEPQARKLQQDLDAFKKKFAVHAPGLFSLDSLLQAEPVCLETLIALLRVTSINLKRGGSRFVSQCRELQRAELRKLWKPHRNWIET